MFINKKLILASASPRRKEILSLLFQDIQVIPANIDESQFTFENPYKTVSKLAELKANCIFKQFKKQLVIGADTIVLLENEVLGKPKDKKDAFSMLKKLSGKKHQVITGVSIKCSDFSKTFFETSAVYFCKLSDYEIEKYISTDEPYDKAGAYAIQGIAACFIEKIKGDYLNIVGFPLNKTYSIFKSYNYNLIT